MKKIVEFTVLSAKYGIDLNKIVNEKILEGWQPFGNLIIYDHRDSRVSAKSEWMLPMVKYQEDK
jgi:hypothetical protein